MAFLNSVQISHRLRWLAQAGRCPATATIGGYHGGNLGDIALGESCSRRIRSHNISSGLQTIYNLDAWPVARYAILGGGAIAYRDCLARVVERYGDTPEHVTVLGVDFNDDQAIREYADFLRQVSVLTCRSKSQATWVGEVLERSDVLSHPDLVFGLFSAAREALASNHKARRNSRVVGLNVTNFFWKPSDEGFEPGSPWEQELRETRPDLMAHNEQLGPIYVAAVQRALQKAKAEGYHVVHLPFTPMDDKFARCFFREQVDRFYPYTSDLNTAFSRFSSLDWFLPTRFHSMVFALLTCTPIIPFCYATKSEHLLSEIGMEDVRTLTALSLVHEGAGCIEDYAAPIVAENGVLQRAEAQVHAVVDKALRAMGLLA